MYSMLIVDDEAVFRSGMRHFLDWESMGFQTVCEAMNGEEAMRRMNDRTFDVVITDIRMPGMDGLALTEWIHKVYPDTRVILLTAYPDFAYAQSGLRYEIVDYVVKSNPLQALRGAVEKAVAQIEQTRRERDKLSRMELSLQTYLKDAKQKLLFDLASGMMTSAQQIREKARQMGVSLGTYCCVVLEAPLHETNDKALSFVQDALRQASGGYQFQTGRQHVCALVETDEASFPTQITTLLRKIDDALQVITGCAIRAGISRPMRGLETVPDAYHQAHDMLFCSGDEERYVFAGQNQHTEAEQAGSAEADAWFAALWQEADTHPDETFAPYLEKAMAQLRALLPNPAAQNAVQQALLGHILHGGGQGEALSPYAQAAAFQRLQRTAEPGQVAALLAQQRQLTLAKRSAQYTPSIQKAMRYIQAHYCHGISLRDIAEHVHLNSSYLSRKYKQETGENILYTINRMRIDKARTLLGEKEHAVSAIGLAVGFDDAAHFCNVFKRYEGLSPSEYRERHGRSANRQA